MVTINVIKVYTSTHIRYPGHPSVHILTMINVLISAKRTVVAVDVSAFHSYNGIVYPGYIARREHIKNIINNVMIQAV
jgi:hypothetical protein